MYGNWDDSFWEVVYQVKVSDDVEASDIAEKILRHLVDIGVFIKGDEFQVCKFGNQVIVSKSKHYINFNVTVN